MPQKKLKDHERRHLLIDEYRDYAENLGRRIIRQLSLPVSVYDEVKGAALLGLVETANTFDFERTTDFRRYAFHRIRGAILDSLRKLSDVMPEAYKAGRMMLAMHDDQSPKVVPKSSNSGFDREARLARVFEHVAKGALAYRLSIEDCPEDHPNFVDEENSSDLKFEKEEDASILRKILEALPSNERMIIEEYYFKGKPFVQICEDDGSMSKSWVSRLHSRALENIRKGYEEYQNYCKGGIKPKWLAVLAKKEKLVGDTNEETMHTAIDSGA